MHAEHAVSKHPREMSCQGGVTPVPLGLAAVFVPKASDVLAEKLRELILSRALAEGTPLPTERELVAQL